MTIPMVRSRHVCLLKSIDDERFRRGKAFIGAREHLRQADRNS